MIPDLDDRLASGLECLRRLQRPSGRLPSGVWGDRALTGPGLDDPTPFVTAFVCPALEVLRCPQAEAIRRRAVGYLVDRCEPPGVWRYWRDQDHVLDPDLDDTACASYAVRQAHVAILCGFNRRLILDNRDGRGRFRTWLRPPERANDVDSVVNANVLTYLGDGPATREAAEWLARLVAEDGVVGSSHYYVLEEASLAYAVSRCVRSGMATLRPAGAELSRRVLAREQAAAGGRVLEAALAVSAWAVLAAEETSAAEVELVLEAARQLAERQREDGSWPEEAFYRGPEPPAPPSVYFGSEALTTALCLEALTLAARAAAART